MWQISAKRFQRWCALKTFHNKNNNNNLCNDGIYIGTFWYQTPHVTLIWTWPQMFAGRGIITPHISHIDQYAPQFTLSHLCSCPFFQYTLLSYKCLLSNTYPLQRLHSILESPSLQQHLSSQSNLLSNNTSPFIVHVIVFKIFSYN